MAVAKKKLRIAFLNIYNGVVDRGAETFVKEVASRLVENHQVSVFQSGDLKGTEGYRVIKIPVNWDWSRKSGVGTLAGRFFIDYWSRQIFIFSLKTAIKIRKEKYDVVIPVNGGWMPAVVRLVTWPYGGKMVISGQSGIGWDDRNNLWCFPNTFVAISTYARNWAKRVNPLVKSVYIPNGVDLGKFKADGDKFESNLRKPLVLCVGALTPAKRIDLAIKAVSGLKNTSLLLVCDGDLRDQRLNLGRKLLGQRFSLVKLPFAEMPEVYRAADVFTLPSKSSHSFEIVLVEAMASGLGVVANNDPIRKEIIGDSGFLVDPEDANSYAQAIKRALSKKWGEKPRDQAKKFDWDEIAKKYETLFLKLCKK